ncbi:kinase-like domain-containing protein [Phycomyces nitens]|nr:kinase-like domain-containing protein [Phycomyces nitens]
MKPFAIAVIETTATVASKHNQRAFPILNIIVETDSHMLSLVRYIPDIIEFDQLVKKHYPKSKIPFPHLTEQSSTAVKRRSLRQILTSLTQHKYRSNADKVERYLRRCSLDSVISTSSLFRDFFSPQRDEDSMESKIETSVRLKQPSPSLIAPSAEISVTADQTVPRSPTSSLMVTKDDVQDNQSLPERPESPQPIHESPRLEYTTAKKAPKPFLLDNLEMVKVLGKGCMGKVFLVRSRTTQELRALKSIVKDLVIEQREITHTLAEREILATVAAIDHPFLAKLHASFQDEHRLYLITDYYCGGDLATQMSTCYTFTPERVLFYAAEIIEGIGELHRLGVLYRDLKPENILLTQQGHIVLTDFGLSKWLTKEEDQATQTFCGTAEYLAPELLLGDVYSFGIDYWSYGTIIYEMLTGITPFWADNHSEMYRRILEEPLEFPTDIDYDTAEFLAALLDRDPATRLGAQGVDEIKTHSYFASLSWDDVYERKLTPPYSPNLTSNLDFANFDPLFIDMEPTFSPMGSQIDPTDDFQHIFDDYSFTDERYFEEEVEPTMILQDSHTVHSKSSFSGSHSHSQSSIYEKAHPDFQPARKRGSISMLSDIDSFNLDCQTSDQRSLAAIPALPLPETQWVPDIQSPKRNAKRRNTGTSEDEDTTPSERHSSLLPHGNDSTFKNYSSSFKMPGLSIASTVEDLLDPVFDDLGFGTVPDLDLQLSFSLDHTHASPGFSTNVTPTEEVREKSKSRRFFPPFIKF